MMYSSLVMLFLLFEKEIALFAMEHFDGFFETDNVSALTFWAKWYLLQFNRIEYLLPIVMTLRC